MSVSSVGGTFFGGIATVVGSNSAAPRIDADGDADGSKSGGVSLRGQFLSKLQALEKSDPAQAKQMLTDLANKMRTEASQPGGDPRRAALADALQKAADSGDLSGLTKADAGQGWSRGPGAYSQTMAVTRASM